MNRRRHSAQIENIYFLSRIGTSLRWATQDIAREELSPEIKHLLARLERLEARAKAKGKGSDGDPVA